MTAISFGLFAWWGVRADDARSCGERLHSWLGGLETVLPELRDWRKGLDRPVPVGEERLPLDSPDACVALLREAQARHRREGEDVSLPLGAEVWGHPGEGGSAAHADIACAGREEAIPNACVLDFATADPLEGRLFEVMRVTVAAWEPLVASLAPRGFQRALLDLDAPLFGGIVYASDEITAGLPREGFRARRCGAAGIVLVRSAASQEPSLEDVRFAREVDAAVTRAQPVWSG